MAKAIKQQLTAAIGRARAQAQKPSRTSWITVRLTPEERGSLSEAAAAAGLSESDLVRACLEALAGMR